jgi:hypothetical protein
MLDTIDLHAMTFDEICNHLRKSCCPALKELVKEAEKNLI